MRSLFDTFSSQGCTLDRGIHQRRIVLDDGVIGYGVHEHHLRFDDDGLRNGER